MAVGDVKYKYNRMYICVNPNPLTGPDTWRVAAPQEVGMLGGGGDGELYQFDGVTPVNLSTKPNAGTAGRTIVETSIDLKELDDRGAD